MATTKVPPFVIVRDSREQDGYDFAGLASVRTGIPTGDYSIVGYEHRVAVERKNKADAWGCVAGERPRFERCLERLAALERAAIVIECDLREFAVRPSYIQRVTPATAVGSYVSWSCKYRIPVFWCDTKAYAERITLRFLVAFLKHCAAPQPATVLTHEPTPLVGSPTLVTDTHRGPVDRSPLSSPVITTDHQRDEHLQVRSER